MMIFDVSAAFPPCHSWPQPPQLRLRQNGGASDRTAAASGVDGKAGRFQGPPEVFPIGFFAFAARCSEQAFTGDVRGALGEGTRSLRWRPPSGRDGPHTLREGRALYLQACQIGHIAAQTVIWCDECGLTDGLCE